MQQIKLIYQNQTDRHTFFIYTHTVIRSARYSSDIPIELRGVGPGFLERDRDRDRHTEIERGILTNEKQWIDALYLRGNLMLFGATLLYL